MLDDHCRYCCWPFDGHFFLLCFHRPSNKNLNVYPALASRTCEKYLSLNSSCITIETLNEHEHFMDFEILEGISELLSWSCTPKLQLNSTCILKNHFSKLTLSVFIITFFIFLLKSWLLKKDFKKICLPSIHPMLFHFCYRVSSCR